MKYWLLKTEPSTYSWNDLVKDKVTTWSGVRNYSARIHLRAMKKGDLVFLYHSVNEKAIQGVAKVIKEAYPDITAKEGDWVAVDIQAVEPLNPVVALEDIKENPLLKNMVLVKNSRLSVQPVEKTEWEACLKMSQDAK